MRLRLFDQIPAVWRNRQYSRLPISFVPSFRTARSAGIGSGIGFMSRNTRNRRPATASDSGDPWVSSRGSGAPAASIPASSRIRTRMFCIADAIFSFSVVRNYRSTRAAAPFMSFLTSSSVAIEVSPGVVMASAPCAAPQLTANSMPSPLISP
ncbi:hypothetical protein SDC9_108735 [bioreactor metagenome]|uniref:Uncharacterized protein n=1 Tax=bioreactor metagenome TaxID=1076179 RepID=A0A645B8X7_9ZZZZ